MQALEAQISVHYADDMTFLFLSENRSPLKRLQEKMLKQKMVLRRSKNSATANIQNA